MINILYNTDFILDIDTTHAGSIEDTLYGGMKGEMMLIDLVHNGAISGILFSEELLEEHILEPGMKEFACIF